MRPQCVSGVFKPVLKSCLHLIGSIRIFVDARSEQGLRTTKSDIIDIPSLFVVHPLAFQRILQRFFKLSLCMFVAHKYLCGCITWTKN